MNEKKEDGLRSLQLEALGRLLAGFSHELKNHLAIIKESNGLIDDKLAMGLIKDKAVAEKFKKIVTTIEKRVNLAAVMAQHLNSFSHRLDTPFSLFHVNETIREELAFLYRFARLKNIDVATELQDDLPPIYNNPSLFQFVFFEIFHYALNRCDKHGQLIVSSEKQDGEIRVAVRLVDFTGDTVSESDSTAEAMQFAAMKMGASLRTPTHNDRNVEIILIFNLEVKSNPR